MRTHSVCLVPLHQCHGFADWSAINLPALHQRNCLSIHALNHPLSGTAPPLTLVLLSQVPAADAHYRSRGRYGTRGTSPLLRLHPLALDTATMGIDLASFSLIRYLIRLAPDIDIGETCRSSAFLLFYPLINTQSFQTFSVGQQCDISFRQALYPVTRVIVAKGTNLDSLFLCTFPDSAKRGPAR